jgi:hypothetical protein
MTVFSAASSARKALLAAAALLAVSAAASPVRASAAEPQVLIRCDAGYVCALIRTNQIITVPAGGGAGFSPPTTVISAVNHTGTNYCFAPAFTLAPGQYWDGSATVSSIGPGSC